MKTEEQWDDKKGLDRVDFTMVSILSPSLYEIGISLNDLTDKILYVYKLVLRRPYFSTFIIDGRKR